MTCGVGCRRSSDSVLLWLWHRPEATALIRPLAWEPPYAAGAALEKTKKKKLYIQFYNYNYFIIFDFNIYYENAQMFSNQYIVSDPNPEPNNVKLSV